MRPQTFGEPSRVDLGPYRSPSGPSAEDPSIWEIDRCEVCGGIWFDAGELAKTLRERLPEEVEVEGGGGVGEQLACEPRISCPRCHQQLAVLRSRAAPWLDYDRCLGCDGIWLEGGALERLEDPLLVILALASGEFA